jgi:hypothetical protein
MASTQLFSGRWILEVVSKEARFRQRFIVQGSDASDGSYPGDLTTSPVEVSGRRWFLRVEWHDGWVWQPSDICRTGASYTVDEGLVTVIGADDSVEPRDRDFDDLVLRCRNLDPQLNPRIPLRNPPDFTLPLGSAPPGPDAHLLDRHRGRRS